MGGLGFKVLGFRGFRVPGLGFRVEEASSSVVSNCSVGIPFCRLYPLYFLLDGKFIVNCLIAAIMLAVWSLFCQYEYIYIYIYNTYIYIYVYVYVYVCVCVFVVMLSDYSSYYCCLQSS